MPTHSAPRKKVAARTTWSRQAGRIAARWFGSSLASVADGVALMGDGVPQKITSAAVPQFDRAAGLSLAARGILDGLYAGQHRSLRVGSSLNFADHRAYQDGDELRSIDWKAFARTDKLLVRRWHDDRQLPICLMLDTSASMAYGAPPKGQTARLAAAVLGLLALSQGDRIRLYLGGRPGHIIPTEPNHLCAALGTVADSGTSASAGAQFLLETAERAVTQRHLLVVLSDFLDPPAELLTHAAALRGRGHELACIQVLDASELALPTTWGASRFTDPENSSANSVDGEAADLAEGYANAFAQHQAELASGCSSVGADMVLLRTDADVTSTLGSWLARRGLR